MRQAVVMLLLLSAQPCVWCFQSGADESACTNLTPNHGAPAQAMPSPFRVTVSPSTYTLNSHITVTLESVCSGIEFEGYLLKIANAEVNATSASLGTFSTPSGSKSLCQDIGRTHTNKDKKQSVSFIWTAPAASVGTIVFRATFVQSKATFWVDVHSEFVYEANKATPPPTSLMTTVQTTLSPSACPAQNQGTFIKDQNCGKTIGCFSDCSASGDGCTFLASWAPTTNNVTITLQAYVGSGNRYAALGLSNDYSMGDDSVNECVYNTATAAVYNSYNPGDNNGRLSNEGVSLINWSYKDQILTCTFTRLKAEGLSGQRFALTGKSYILFLAIGSSSTDAANAIYQHDNIPAASTQAISLEDTSVDISSADITSPLVKAHGSLMMVAWIFAASVGIVMARYFKPMWPESKLLGEKVWFQIHRGSMVLVLLCTVIAFIIIFVKEGEYSEISGEDYKKAHPVLGIIVTALCIINPIMALFRCHPGTKNRPIFNWAHWAVGFTAYILGVITIFFGVKLEGAGAPEYIVYVLAAFVCWQILVFLILELVQLLGKMSQSSNTYELGDPKGSPKPVGEKTEAVLAKNVLLAVHIAALTGFIIALLVILNRG